MQLAKVTSKGQITLPSEIREALGLKEGDRVAFVRSESGYILANSNQLALKTIQEVFAGEAEKAGLKTDDDAMALVEEYREKKR